VGAGNQQERLEYSDVFILSLRVPVFLGIFRFDEPVRGNLKREELNTSIILRDYTPDSATAEKI
jgi:hypothetical protein